MRLAFLVNSIKDEYPRFTTTMLAQSAISRGHEVVYLTPGDFVLGDDDSLTVRALHLPDRKFQKPQTLHKALQSDEVVLKTIDCTELDVLFLRNDPADDAGARPWAAQAGVMFGRLASERGVLVVNDPGGLAQAQNKLYFQGFPEAVRPPSLISKNIDEIRAFIEDQTDAVIVKPLQGSGGHNVFKVDSASDANLNQIFEAVSEEGYLIAQTYIPEATAGDIRFFLMNGVPLESKGRFAALRRVPAKNEVRSNMHAKGTAEKVKVTDNLLAVAEMVRPKLISDGMFLVGLDVVGEKVLEINVFTPGALYSIAKLERTDFAGLIIEALERKLEIRAAYRGKVSNATLATM